VISVVIPLYNKADTVERTVRSVLAQTLDDFELLVLDDGSTDGSLQVVQGIRDPRIRCVTQANAGVAAARNRGAELASHDLVAFLDADDLWEPDHLDNLARLHAAYPKAAMYATAYKVVGESGAMRPIRLRDSGISRRFGTLDDYFRDIVEIEHPIHCSALMVHKDILASVGGFPAGVKYGEDLIACSRLACAGVVAYSREATARYHLPPVSAARSALAIKRPELPDFVGAELRRLQDGQPRLGPSIARFRGEWHRIRATLFLQFGDRLPCLSELGRAVLASGLRRRDVASVGLLALPLPLQHHLLAWWRLRFGRV
jgi:glycosyltransferase involved in cell wall biosynthesis